jgi:hypothetical protein
MCRDYHATATGFGSVSALPAAAIATPFRGGRVVALSGQNDRKLADDFLYGNGCGAKISIGDAVPPYTALCLQSN